jgi:hypothetical protein
MFGQRTLSQKHQIRNQKERVALFQFAVTNAEEFGQGTEDFLDHAAFQFLDHTSPGIRSSFRFRKEWLSFAPNDWPGPPGHRAVTIFTILIFYGS